MERQVLQIIEENPKRIIQHLRMIEEKETSLWADNMQRHNKQFEGLQQLKVRTTQDNDNLAGEMLKMRKQMEDLSYRNVELRRNMEALAVRLHRNICDKEDELRLLFLPTSDSFCHHPPEFHLFQNFYFFTLCLIFTE